MAAALGVRPASLQRWQIRSSLPVRPRRRRKSVMSPEVCSQLRVQYLNSLRLWGPNVLRHWAERQGLGSFSASTVARAIASLVPSKPAPKPTLRYTIDAPGVMWSEDGAAFKQDGDKRELVLIQDECSRLKVGHRLASGPAKGEDVRQAIEEAFEEHGAPLVLNRDGGSIFDEASVMELLDEYGVTVITSPPSYPRYNGRMERAVRDVRCHERAQREHGHQGTLGVRIINALHDLNFCRPRPVLGGLTAWEAHTKCRWLLPERSAFQQAVADKEAEFLGEAASRHERDRARRRAAEHVLQSYELMNYTGYVSTDCDAQGRTS